jgi:acyl-CoA synthetase (NDP forming)
MTDNPTSSYFEAFFKPRGIALIGASANPHKWGFRVLTNMVAGGYQGLICPVNPKGGTLLGLQVYPSLKAIPNSVNLAVITIPAPLVPQALEDCAVKGIRSIVVISSGFSETGPEGRGLETTINRIARNRGLHFIGPNTMGIFSAESKLHALMPPLQPLTGKVSYVSQSGNVGVQMLAWGKERGVGFSKFVSSGNEGDLQCEDYLEYFSEDPETKILLAYIEGLENGRRFLDMARKATRTKPLILFKSGKSEAGTKAALSHSGALAGQYRLYQAAFQQAGVIEAETSDNLLDYTAAFLHYPLPKGNKIAILTRGGGWGVIAADACREWGLELAPLSERLIQKLDKVLPVYWSRGNPLDMAATLNTDAFPICLEEVIKEETVDGIIALGVEFGKRTSQMVERLREMNLLGGIEIGKAPDEHRDIQLIMELMAVHQKPIVMVSGLSTFTKSYASAQRKTVLFPTPERAARAMGKLWLYSRYLQRQEQS